MSMLANVDLGGDHAVLGSYRVYQERRALRVATITNRAWALAATSGGHSVGAMLRQPPASSDRSVLEQIARDISVIRLIVQSAFVLSVLGAIAIWYNAYYSV